ncbi:MAG: FG-GAP repeat protein [Planctomycetota bacterium]
MFALRSVIAICFLRNGGRLICLPLVLLITAPLRTARAQCEHKITASDACADSRFGIAVSVEANLALIGAPVGRVGTGPGAAYVYRFTGGTWVEEQKLFANDGQPTDMYGHSVCIRGDLALVGVPGDDDACPSDPTCDSGSAYVYRFDGSTWVQEQKLSASDATAHDNFGITVAVSEEFAMVGAYRHDLSKGAIYVFRFDGTSWVETQKLTANDAEPGDNYGRPLYLEGTVAATGAVANDDAGSDSGAAYILRYDGSRWVEEQKLTGSDASAGDYSHVICVSGDVAVVGAQGDDDACPGDPYCNSGSAYIFRFNGSSWVEEQKLVASDAEAGDNFGAAVGIVGDVVLIGAILDDDACPSDPSCNSGAVYVYRYDGSNWFEESKLTASDGEQGDTFGRLAFRGNVALVGADRDDDGGSDAGSAYLYVVDSFAASWTNYGDGWPGTNGIPGFTSQGRPVLGTSVVLDIDNSLGASTAAVLLIGLAPASVDTALGGKLLVVPRFTIPFVLPGSGAALPGEIPCDGALSGLALFLQILERDVGASRGVSFTRGLRLDIGSY